MDKNAIKKYAVWARRELISRVSQKALQYGITDKDIVPATATSVNGVVLSAEEMKQRKALIEQINAKGYAQVMEEVAYTWFNRFIALRFMEVNGYLPSHVRVFTDEDNAFKPQILTEAINLEVAGLDMEKVYALKDTNDNDGLFKYLIIVQCNALSPILPRMFQRIADYTELLFPDNLLRDGSAIEQMIKLIPAADWKDAVQIIGWLYQYYNTEPKDKVFADLKKNIKITKENIPAATQLFTPDWIVRYMVENSLGRLWLEGHPDVKDQFLPTEAEQSAYVSGNRDLKNTKWHYYLEEAEQEPEVQAQLAEIRKEYATLTPEQLKVIDPCCGSGHILAYMFDVLMQIYEAYGHTSREAVRSIVENNIYGLDIDDRAAQLAYFAVMMKARQYDRRFFAHPIQPNVYVIQESNWIGGAFPFDMGEFLHSKEHQETLNYLIDAFQDAKEYGSILQLEQRDYSGFIEAWELTASQTAEEIGLLLWYDAIKDAIPEFAKIAIALTQKYQVVCTNPPYMGTSNMNSKLSDFIKTNYTDYKSDFFSAFFVRCSQLASPTGILGFFSPYVWMFIQSYEKWRNLLCLQKTVETLIQFEYSAFEEATVPVCTFVFSNYHVNKRGCYLRLTDFRGGMEVQRKKTLEAIANHDCGYYYEQSTDNFSKIPGAPIAYWASQKALLAYHNPNMDSIAQPRHGLATSDNDRFLKLWHEIDVNKASLQERCRKDKKWFPMSKGGSFRRWYGNLEWVINYEDDGKEIKDYAISIYKCSSRTIQNTQFYFQEGLTWSALTSGGFSVRWQEKGALFGSGGYCAFVVDSLIFYVLALLNSKVTSAFAQFVSPTLNYEVGHIKTIPVVVTKNSQIVTDYALNNISLSRSDWDSFETSWDFQCHPLVRLANKTSHKSNGIPSYRVEDAYWWWENESETRFQTLKANEEELNRIFIDIYGLQDELSPEVEEKDVTVRRANLGQDIRNLISYAVGCMFGRYSLYKDGLTFAGGAWNINDFGYYGSQYYNDGTFPKQMYCSRWFMPDEDNILPICDDDYFEDDIVGRFVQWVETVYGKATLEENLKFIADSLGGNGQPKDVIRNYFLNDFFNDHCKIYQKRPIYWLFDSGKKNGFKCLIYMHRYQPDTIARIRTDYVHEQQSRYRTAIADLEQRIASASTSERVKLSKRLKKLQEQAAEIQGYEEKIHHLADQYIAIDLDDGVKVNYAKFQDVLAKIK